VAVAGHVHAEAAQHVDELLAVDVAENRAVVLPLDRGIVGADGLAVLEEALVDVVGPILDRVLDHLLLLGVVELLLPDEIDDVRGFLQRGFQILAHASVLLRLTVRRASAQRERRTKGKPISTYIKAVRMPSPM